MKTRTIESLVRPNILALQPYSSARDEFSGNEGVFLDANENPFGTLNRYPDPHQKALKAALSEFNGIPTESIFIGNGSDEVIDLVHRVFAEPGNDAVIVCPPTYGMYEVSANIHNVNILKIPLTGSFQPDIEEILRQAEANASVKLLFLCSPNNPTGNLLEGIEEIVRQFPGIVIVDEAYIDFCSGQSVKRHISTYPNLIVMQTLSKAWALAGARVGIAYAQPEIIALFNKTKPPYNVSQLNQKAAIDALSRKEVFERRKTTILEQRIWLKNELTKAACVKKIYPSDANFLLVEVSDANAIYDRLVHEKVIVRNRHSQVRNCLRVTVGSPEENQKLIEILRNIIV